MESNLHQFKVGDLVRVISVPSDLEDPLGMGTTKVFAEALGKVFPVEDIDEYGHLSLVVLERHPTEDTYESDTIWIEPEHVVLVESAVDDGFTDERARRERFYEGPGEQRRAEFINGEVFVQPPSMVRHIDVVGHFTSLLSIYVGQRDLGWSCFGAMVSLTHNDYKPDVVFYGRAKAALLEPDLWKFPAPDFVVEVLSPSTERHDRGIKFEDYAAHGVAEYWIIDPAAQTVEQYALPADGTAYQAVGTWSGSAEIVSVAVPGFRLPAVAVFEVEANLAALAALVKR